MAYDFSQYQPIPTGEPIGVGGPANTFDPNGPERQALGGGTTTMQPSAGGGGDYQSTFMRIMGGLPATPANLAAKEQELAAAGITVKRNAEGTAGKIKLPTGQIVDVIQSAGTGGGGNWQWLTGPSGGGAGGPFGNIGNFQVGMFTGGGQFPLASVMGTGLAAPWTTPFVAPTDVTEQNDPGYAFRQKEGSNALGRMFAKNGTLLSGGFGKALSRYNQDYASGEYGNVYARKLGEYMMAHNIFNENQGNLFNRLGYLGSIGENAAAGVGNAQLGMGQAAGQGSIAQGNIWGNVAGGLGQTIGDIYQQTHQPNPNAPSTNNTSYVPGTFYPPGTFTP